ncbi:hypothetical protein MsedC_1426 [Metallosphaera sedula]|uniref:Uncharacterized protein n=2 Tax=Metallosphaera sedula TaxID=43687 RepID=A4YGL3_METS5|nr:MULTISPECIES: hypothetical protein [Metallosphaera]ABP95565.1 hypothetical protein Msed_1407 [Metallosphaera sedula DSM 5348]AKV78902.1 hypothetical protein MsedC_1426 [Metallosphaera sedula]AKV81147.1 hypothetical protein MsedD_1427 [Metallosphaera sedula]AKV83385.1 hypothetical protein MsedE_1432 [Metallosphaera sedula]MCY0860901.1 hypothetical protein [Metallosphaera prunae]
MIDIEDFLRCMGKVVEIRRVTDLEWTFKLRDAIMLSGILRVNPGIVTDIEFRFRSPDGIGRIKITKGTILEASYEGILSLQLRPRVRDCSKILVGRETP